MANINYLGHTFSGYGKPRKSWRPGKKYAVLVKEDGKDRVVHFGAVGYQDFLQHKDKDRRANFKSRMRCHLEKNKATPKWRSCQYSWIYVGLFVFLDGVLSALSMLHHL